MPYIEPKERPQFDKFLDQIPVIFKKGQLEYCVAKLMNIYMKDKEKTYTEWHNCVYAVQHCSDEYRRRFLDKREDYAKDKNGDIT
jgi:hypothetical protein